MAKETIRISAVEAIEIERMENTVRLSVLIGAAPILSKHITPDAARQLGDALGYLSNDIARPAL